MKAQTRILSMILSTALLCNFGYAEKNRSKNSLPQHHRVWLEQDVVYIIAPQEKDVFLKLESDRERNIFIEAFWKQRDPTPGTPANEFKEEHYRRIAYANEYFGRETTRSGWQTDRGKVYIILGPPLDIGRHEGGNTIYPSRIWSYSGNLQLGLPPHFNLIFFKRKGMGEYVLYSPARDGPAGLLIHYRGDPANIMTAYEQIRKYDARLADTSLSLIPRESMALGHISLESEILLNKINSVPEKKIDSKYAEALLKYKDIVEVEYTSNYVRSDNLIEVLQDESGFFFVHYLIQPKQLSVLSYEEKYNINFEINGMVKDTQGNVVFQYEKTFPLEFTRDQIEDIQKTSIAIRDMIPLVAGDYGFSLLLKNTISKEFTSFEERISIPPKKISIYMSSILLGYQQKKELSQKNANKPFKINDVQIECQAGNVFHPKENLVVFFQLFNLTEDVRDKGTLTFRFLKKEEEFLKKEKRISDYVGNNILEEFPLQDFPSDYYKIRVSITDGTGHTFLSDDKDFEISPLTDLPRPWIVSKVLPPSSDSEYSYILGNQHLRKGNLDEAEKLLTKAHNEDPLSLKYAMSYGNLLHKKKEHLRAKQVLIPFSKDPQNHYPAFYLLGTSCQALGEYEEAISFYEEYLLHSGMNLNILNSIGQCYYELGNIKEALETWEKSLEINPNQEALKKLIDQLKKN